METVFVRGAAVLIAVCTVVGGTALTMGQAVITAACDGIAFATIAALWRKRERSVTVASGAVENQP
jgi:hypothetical protein